MNILRSANIPPERSANKKGAADWFGVSLPTLDTWIARGCPIVQRGSKGVPWVLDLLEVAKWRFGADDVPEGEFNPDGLTPRERKDWYDGEAKRLDIAERLKELVSIDSHREEVARICKFFAGFLEDFPDTLEREVNLSPDAVIALQHKIDAMRTLLADKLTEYEA